MRRSTRFIAISIGVIVGGSLVVAMWSGQISPGSGAIAGDLNRPTPTTEGAEGLQPVGSPGPLTRVPGVEAIKVAELTPPGMPAFSEEAAREYLTTNPPAYWDSSTPPPEFLSIQFLSARDAEAIIGDRVPRDPDDLICIVKMRGTFIPRLPPGVTPVAVREGQSTVVVIFDAITGNLLGQGYISER